MANTSMNIRMDGDVKRQAQELFAQFGLDMTTAVNMFLRQAIRQQGIPFALQLDPFYNEANQERLLKTAARTEKTGGTVHDLEEEKERRAAWLERLSNLVTLSMDEEFSCIPRSKQMRKPVNFSE